MLKKLKKAALAAALAAPFSVLMLPSVASAQGTGTAYAPPVHNGPDSKGSGSILGNPKAKITYTLNAVGNTTFCADGYGNGKWNFLGCSKDDGSLQATILWGNYVGYAEVRARSLSPLGTVINWSWT